METTKTTCLIEGHLCQKDNCSVKQTTIRIYTACVCVCWRRPGVRYLMQPCSLIQEFKERVDKLTELYLRPTCHVQMTSHVSIQELYTRYQIHFPHTYIFRQYICTCIFI